MDNYLSHRWPQGALVTQRPEKARQKKKKRRVLRTLAVCLLLAALLVGLMAAGWFLAQKALEQWAADLGRPEQSAAAWRAHAGGNSGTKYPPGRGGPWSDAGAG